MAVQFIRADALHIGDAGPFDLSLPVSKLLNGGTVARNSPASLTIEDYRPATPAMPMTVAVKIAGTWRVLPAEAVFPVERA